MKYKNREEFVIKNIEKYKKRKNNYLDIGFVGEYEKPFMHYEILKTLNSNDRLSGLDINPKIGNIENDVNIKPYLEQVKYKKESIFDSNEQGFDIVTLLEVFEHLPHPYLALHKIYDKLNKNGTFLLTYPNPLNIGIFYRYIFRKNILDKDFLKIYKGADDHKIFPMPPCMVIYLEDLGFEVKEVSYIKGKLNKIPFLDKFSDYIGIVAVKK